MENILLLLSALVVILYPNGSSGRVAPDYIQPCPGLKSDCLKKTIQEVIPLFAKGIPEVGVDTLDPLKLDYMSLDLVGGLKIELIDGGVYGLRKCIIDSVKFENDVADYEIRCNVTYKGKYKAKGKILVITLNGDGDAKVKISGMVINLKAKFKDITRDGVVYKIIENYDVAYRVADRVTYNLTNLFQGNPALSQTVLTFLNENWKVLMDEFGRPIFDKMIGLVSDIIKKFFENVPKNEIFVD